VQKPRPPANVVLIDRIKEYRAAVNPDSLVKVLKRLGVNYTHIPTMKGSWEDHARLLHSAGVLLNAHGSGNTNSFFQQPGSAALEMHGYGQDFKEW
jgi:hypothetical protein